MKLDRIIFNGIVITVNPDFEIIEDGVVGIKDGVIQFVEDRIQPISEYDADDLVLRDGTLSALCSVSSRR